MATIYKQIFKLTKQNSLFSRFMTTTTSISNDEYKIKLILYTKSNCSLCDQAKEFIDENYPNKFVIEEVDITKDKTTFRKFKFDIPVFYHNGEFLMKHRADTARLDDLIKKYHKNY
jgi:hypothetical protein